MTLGGYDAAATALLPIDVAIAAHVSRSLGSLGGGLIVLVWLYLMSLSLFLDAELNATCLPRPARGDNSTGPRP